MAGATRKDVAARAGVSTAVVSYVVNGGPRPVAEQTRARVMAAVRELNYRPNTVARSLRTARTRAVGLVIPDASNTFFAQLARDIEMAAFGHDVTMLLGNSGDDPELERRYLETFVDRRVDGLILAPTGSGQSTEALEGTRLPVVVIDRELPGVSASVVAVDNHHGGYRATRHLIEHGHRRIAIVTGPASASSASERRRGWLAAMSESDLDVTGLEIQTSFTRSEAYDAVRERLARADRPSAIFASADEQAFGIYRAAADLGIRIPDDLAVVSFDGSDSAPFFVPTLTAVHQPTGEIARRAVQALIDHITDPTRTHTREILGVNLVVRSSCGCDAGSAATRKPSPTT